MNTFISKELNDLDFILQKHKFRIDSTSDLYFSLVTDSNCGIIFTGDGKSYFVTDTTSTEVVGGKLDPVKDKGAPGKHIQAINGDIVLEAKNGNIVLRGKNIKIDALDSAGGQIVIDSSKIIQTNAPITRMQGDNITLAASNNVSVAGGTADLHGQMSHTNTTGTDIVKASFFGKILIAIEKFKDFFNSICAVP